MFLHGYLLFGLLLAGVPVALHLLLRQKPRRVVFPAFRFLVQRQQTNQRRMRLRHLLLMLLRMAVLSLLVLALARPRLFNNRVGSTLDQPMVAILLFDTSASMGYAGGGGTRLDEALVRGRELLDEMAPTSRVAILDAGESGPEAFVSPVEGRTRLKAIQIRPTTGALNRAVERALDQLARSRAEATGDPPPHLLIVLSDRTRASWDQRGSRPTIPPDVHVLYVDVGSKSPVNLGIETVEITPASVAPGGRYDIKLKVRGTPGGHENDLTCQLGDEPLARQPVKLEKDQTHAVISFERTAPRTPGPHGLTFRLAARDALPADDQRHGTIVVRGVRRLLTLVETPEAAHVWNAAHDALGAFANDTKTFDAADPRTLSEYAVVALLHPRQIPPAWRDPLLTYVRNGGGLAVVPGETALVDDALLPGPLLTQQTPARPTVWKQFSAAHTLTRPFVAWSQQADPDFARPELLPLARRYWRIGKLATGANMVARYDNGDVALADRVIGRGRVLLFSTPLDVRLFDGARQWTNYWQDSSFGFVLIDRSTRFLAGEEVPPEMRFVCGIEPSVRVPSPMLPPYTLDGPGVAGAGRTLPTPPASGEISLPQARQPGNYVVRDGRSNPVAGFSLDLAVGETDLTRIPGEELSAIFGDKSIVEPGQNRSLRDSLAVTRPPPVELLPWLLLLLLGVMTLEGVFANRFYSDDTPTSEAKAA